MHNDGWLDEFIVRAVQYPPIPVCIPRGPFRIHPVDMDCTPLFWVTRYEGKWYLVASDIVESEFVPGKLQAILYRGIRKDGSLFVLPVTLPTGQSTETWYEAWEEIVEIAYENWVQIEPNPVEGRHDYIIVRLRESAAWPDIPYETWIKQAFGNRVITHSDHPALKSRKQSRQEVEED